VVGSSRKIIPGFVTNSTPIEVLFRYPPDIPLMNVFPIFVLAHELNPRSTISYSTLSFSCYSFKFKVSLAANKKHYLGVSVPSNASSCITYPIWFEYGSRDVICWEFILIYPEMVKLSETSLDERKFNNVVLPEPDGPKMAVKLSAWIRPFCRWRIVLVYFLILASILTS